MAFTFSAFTFRIQTIVGEAGVEALTKVPLARKSQNMRLEGPGEVRERSIGSRTHSLEHPQHDEGDKADSGHSLLVTADNLGVCLAAM